MREWSERHIRELVRQEYNRMGGGDGKFFDLRETVRNYIKYTLLRDNVQRMLDSYLIWKNGEWGIAARTDMEFRIETATVELFQIPELTDAQREQIITAYGSDFDLHYTNFMRNTFFYKAHIEGYFKHNYLYTGSNLIAFYYVPVSNTYDQYNIYYPQIDNDNYCLPYIDESVVNEWNGFDWGFGVHPIPMILPLDAILPTKNPLTSVDEYEIAGHIRRYITDKNDPTRHLLFEYERGGVRPDQQYTVTWLDGGPYQDYADKKLYFEFDTFIGRQVEYGNWDKIQSIINP